MCIRDRLKVGCKRRRTTAEKRADDEAQLKLDALKNNVSLLKDLEQQNQSLAKEVENNQVATAILNDLIR